MNLYEWVGKSESHPVYQKLAASSVLRQYHFLDSVIVAALEARWPKVSNTLICALNHHAITCLHTHAGQFRPWQVTVENRDTPLFYLVPDLMDEMVSEINRYWDQVDDLLLGAYALWRLNWIHPFINGNGRTARALCYYLICVKNGGFPTDRRANLPALIGSHYEDYLNAIREAHELHEKHFFPPYVPVLEFLKKITTDPPPVLPKATV